MRRLARDYGVFVVAVVAWQFASLVVSPVLLPAPLDVASALVLWSTRGLPQDVMASLSRVAVGYTIAAGFAVSLGIATASSRQLRKLTPIVDLLRPIPPIAWIPLAILWLGISSAASAFIVFLGAFFPVFTATHTGVQAISQDVYNTARCLGVRGRLLVTNVLLPAAFPHVFGGLRTGLGVAWMSLIAAELLGAQSGLGHFIQTSRLLLDTGAVVAGMIVIGALGLAMNGLLAWIGRRLMPWNQNLRTDGGMWRERPWRPESKSTT
jgi:ABC-type nitrate/sulfonate/bicarbonate transport system permease component